MHKFKISASILTVLVLAFFPVAGSIALAATPSTVDLNNVYWQDTDVSSWPQDASLNSVSISGRTINLNYSTSSPWDPADVFGDGTLAVGNAWIFVYQNNQWQAATFDYLRPGQTQKDTSNITDACGALHGTLASFHPQANELYGFMVSTVARTGAAGTNGQHRTNIVMQKWTGETAPTADGCSTSTPNPVVPETPPTISNIIPGYAKTGETIKVTGTSLSDKVSLVTSSDEISNIPATVNQDLSITSFQVPNTVQDGSYLVKITNGQGSALSTVSLVVMNSGPPLSTSTPPPIANQGLPTDFGSLIQTIFNWSINIMGIVVFLSFFVAGFQWFTAAGNTATVSAAQDRMKNAVLGAILLFSAYLILYTINPDLVKGTFGLPSATTPTSTSSPNPDCSIQGLYYQYSSAVDSATQSVLSQNPSLANASLSDGTSVSSFLDKVAGVLKGQGYKAGRAKNCNGVLSKDSIIVGQANDQYGEYYDLLKGAGAGKGTIKDAVIVLPVEHAKWERLVQ